VLIDDLLQIILEICLPYVQSKGNSIKFHWPRHWVYFRLNLGCSADEKSLERKLAETQKKFYRFTNGKDNTSDQISKKNMQAWTLRDVLHAGALRPMEDIDDILSDYKPGSPENKPDVVKQILEIKNNRETMMKEQMRKEMEYRSTMQKLQNLNNPEAAQNKINELSIIIQELNMENTQLKEKVKYLEDKMKIIVMEQIQKRIAEKSQGLS
jgi:hypothetical protein